MSDTPKVDQVVATVYHGDKDELLAQMTELARSEERRANLLACSLQVVNEELRAVQSESAAIAPPTRLDVLREVEQRLHDCYNLQRASAWPHCAGVSRAEVIVRAMIEEAKK